jgi:antitoxin MazE
METRLPVKKWGSGLGVRSPSAITLETNLHADQEVTLGVEAGRVIVEPVPADHLTLSERLDRFDPLKHGGEVMADDRISAERLLTVYP